MFEHLTNNQFRGSGRRWPKPVAKKKVERPRPLQIGIDEILCSRFSHFFKTAFSNFFWNNRPSKLHEQQPGDLLGCHSLSSY